MKNVESDAGLTNSTEIPKKKKKKTITWNDQKISLIHRTDKEPF